MGGPTGVVLGILGFLINAFLNKRKDDREEVRLGRESESGIVETTKKAIQLVREEMTAMQLTLMDQRRDHSDQIERLRREHQEEVQELSRDVVRLTEENRSLKLEVAELRGWR